MDRRPSVEEASRYYEHAMTNTVTKIFCRMGGKKKFSESDIEGMKKTASLRAGDRNLYLGRTKELHLFFCLGDDIFHNVLGHAAGDVP